MKGLFSQSALGFTQFWVFESIFEARGKKFPIFKNCVFTFYCTQNDSLDPMVSMQKLVWKTDQPGPRYLQKCFQTWHAKPRRNPILFFSNISAQGGPFFKTDVCIETRESRRLFWVQLKVETEFSKNCPQA